MLRTSVGRATTLCMSLSARPGLFGSRFHNYLYDALGLDYVYKAFSTRDLAGAVAGIRALGIRGCAVSMPFKEACIPMLDALAPSAAAIDSVNTIVNDDGRLTGHNTDYGAIVKLLRQHDISPDTSFALAGSGGMAKAVASALRDAGFRDGLIISRNEQTGRALAELCHFHWHKQLDDQPRQLLVNVTPIGMAGSSAFSALPFSEPQLARAERIFDVVAVPVETPLIQRARALGKPVITGGEVIALQALEQFVLYTGLTPGEQQVAAAVAFASGP